MQLFEKRRDRFNLFECFENPLLNITFRLEVPDFLPACKERKLPPFHLFLYHLFEALKNVENFHYRIYQGQVIKIDTFIPSYTVMNQDDILNYTRFEYTQDKDQFIARSLRAKEEAASSAALINDALELDPRRVKDYFFITCLPWLDFTAIEHPTFKYKSADIPSIAWGKFRQEKGILSMPFSVQAHHGFVDGYHIHRLAEELKTSLRREL
jgi:chloramphenicol O-acetyltransferase type A